MNIAQKYFTKDDKMGYDFFKSPKFLFTHPSLIKLSDGAKLLYIVLLGRLSLSVKNKWFDASGRVYVYYSLKQITHDLGCCTEKAIKIFSELDEKKGVGLIERKRSGFGKPCVIYFVNPQKYYSTDDETTLNDETENIFLKESEKKGQKENAATEYVGATDVCTAATDTTDIVAKDIPGEDLCKGKSALAEIIAKPTDTADIYTADIYTTDIGTKDVSDEFFDKTKEKTSEFQSSYFGKTDIETSDNPIQTLRENRYRDFGKTEPNKNEINYINNNYNDLNYNHSISLSDGNDEKDKEFQKKYYESFVKNNICYHHFQTKIPQSRVDEFVAIITDVLCSDEPYIKIGGKLIKHEKVKERFETIEFEHLQYVYESINKLQMPVRNIRAYIITALYNSVDSVSLWMDANDKW